MVVPCGTPALVLLKWFVSRDVPTGVPCSNARDRSAKRAWARRRKGQTLRPNRNEQRGNDKMRYSGHPH
ncbi:unnamed protein product [Brassica oleracea]